MFTTITKIKCGKHYSSEGENEMCKTINYIIDMKIFALFKELWANE